MSERERELKIPNAGTPLRIEPTNGGWLVWTGSLYDERGRMPDPPIPVVSSADLAQIVTAWSEAKE